MNLESLTTLEHQQQVLINMEPLGEKDVFLSNRSNLIDTVDAEKIYDDEEEMQKTFRDNFCSLASTVFHLEDCLMEGMEE